MNLQIKLINKDLKMDSHYVVDKSLDHKINLQEDSTINVDVKRDAVACLFFECKGQQNSNTQINIELDESASCELYGFFKNKNKKTSLITNVIHRGNKSKCNHYWKPMVL